LDIKFLKGVGEKRARAFNEIGISKLEDFLEFVPRTYIEKIQIKDLKNYFDNTVIIYGTVTDLDKPSSLNRPTVLTFYDGTGYIEIPVFGSSEFRAKQFRLNERYLFLGKVGNQWFGKALKLDYRDHIKINTAEPLENEFLKRNLFPIYELQGVLKKTFIRPLLLSKIVYSAFRKIFDNEEIKFSEIISKEIIESEKLLPRKTAIIYINFPDTLERAEQSRRRLAFDELFYLQLLMALRKRNNKKEKKGIKFEADIKKLTEDFKKCLNFELTNAQKRVINEIYLDMKSDTVMNRLLQGDVGSGKTIVSLYMMLIAIENGYQSAMMCPTEILAEQHFKTISDFIEKFNKVSGRNIKVEILTGSQNKKIRESIYNSIKSGEINIIVGTHSLIQEKVEFAKLGFTVIDEQHKFGVMQRAKLIEKGLNRDVLVMTATPIPRTLSLTLYGDLDVSVIDELPANRKPIITKYREESDKHRVYEFVKEKINEGRQAYIVFPIIEESEKLDLKSAVENYNILKNTVFKDYSVGMIHGKMSSDEKDEVMKEFKENKIHILVATTVIEVGIDVPNSTIMIIEEAQRFGLSQLHQLRGRVGRGAEQSYCILIGKNLDDIARKRMQIMCSTNNGFEISEADLEIRGPGEFYGVRQSGTLNFFSTDLSKDKDLLERAREKAFDIIEKDPHLRNSENSLIRDHFLGNYKDALSLMNIA